MAISYTFICDIMGSNHRVIKKCIDYAMLTMLFHIQCKFNYL